MSGVEGASAAAISRRGLVKGAAAFGAFLSGMGGAWPAVAGDLPLVIDSHGHYTTDACFSGHS